MSRVESSRHRLDCSHSNGSLKAVYTELGCRPLPNSEAVGPERPNSEAARQALLVLGARTADADNGSIGRRPGHGSPSRGELADNRV